MSELEHRTRMIDQHPFVPQKMNKNTQVVERTELSHSAVFMFWFPLTSLSRYKQILTCCTESNVQLCFSKGFQLDNDSY